MLNDEHIADWIYLPAGIEETSLWACLHDAELQTIHSDALERTLSLEFGITHLIENQDDLRFILMLSGVKSIRALKWQNWPGNFHAPSDISRSEESRLVGEFKAKGREESVTWTDLEEEVISERFEVIDADAAFGDDQMTLQLQGYLRESDIWYSLFMRGQSLSVIRSDGEHCSLKQLIALGEAYWNKFPKHKSA